VGVEPIATKYIQAGDTETVNGKTLKFSHCWTLIRTGKLKEVTVCALGADSDTLVSIAAKRQEGQEMAKTKTKTIPAPADIEQQRIDDINASFSQETEAFRTEAISEGWSTEQASAVALKRLRASRANISFAPRSYAPPTATTDSIEAKLMMKAGYHSLAEKLYDEQTLDATDRLPGNLQEIAVTALKANNIDVPQSKNEMITAAFSTSSMPVALGNTANKILMHEYASAPAAFQEICDVVPLSNFHEAATVRPNLIGDLKPMGAGGEFKHASTAEETGSVQLGTFGEMLRITRQQIVNDDMDVFQKVPRAFAKASLRTQSGLFTKVLLANAGNFFHTNNGNLLTGAGSVLDVDGMDAAFMALIDQADAEGNTLDMRPSTLLVPSSLTAQGVRIISSDTVTLVPDGDTDETKWPTGNSYRGTLKLQTEARLKNTNYVGNSATAWYLFSHKNDAAMQVAYLDGNQYPTIEYFGLDSRDNTLGCTWRIYHDFGFALGDPKAVVKSTGL